MEGVTTMLAYVYQADLYCEDCATQIKAELAYSHEGQPEHLFDSDEYPKGPYPAGESDTPITVVTVVSSWRIP
jgi:hypothetical protein